MARWHHRLNGHEFVRTPGVDDGQAGLACCDSWGHKESDTTERLTLPLLLLSAYTTISLVVLLPTLFFTIANRKLLKSRVKHFFFKRKIPSLL